MTVKNKIKKIIQIGITFFTLSLTFSINQLAVGECINANNHHADHVVHRCTYTQEDLQRAYQKTPERYQKTVCFYCGCSIEKHTSLSKKDTK